VYEPHLQTLAILGCHLNRTSATGEIRSTMKNACYYAESKILSVSPLNGCDTTPSIIIRK
jgi:hypothetical protein